MKFSKAFTIIELIFVIVILGILSAVALPKFTGIRDRADIANGKATLASIRTAIVNERQTRLILGDSDYITRANLSSAASSLFDGVLSSRIVGSDTAGNWYATAANIAAGKYYYNVAGVKTEFIYENTDGNFTCAQAGTNNCNDLTN